MNDLPNAKILNSHGLFTFMKPDGATMKKKGMKGRGHGMEAEILVVTSFPPRECGIATYSHDLISALNNKFNRSFSIRVCALESGETKFSYGKEVQYVLNTSRKEEYSALAKSINQNIRLEIVLFQHEFGLYNEQSESFLLFLEEIKKPVMMVFHTVLSNPDDAMLQNVKKIVALTESIIVMTKAAASILINEYNTSVDKISIIPHGTHLVPYLDKNLLKEKYRIKERMVLSTFGLLSSGKSIETTLEAMPSIVANNPNVLFLVIGKTHPDVVKTEGEKYRDFLQKRVEELYLMDHVLFINAYLPLEQLLEYLQLTDIYLFTSKNPAQAVSGTFSYAMGCGCAIISTPIPHVKEVLNDDAGVIIDFENSEQLSKNVIRLMEDDALRNNIRSNALHKIVSTAWENSAVAHASLFDKVAGSKITLNYNLPIIKLDHLKKLTTDFGMIQFSKINQPDIDSGYTLDDNARALVAICMHYEATGDKRDLVLIRIYIDFLLYCQQPKGDFLNYVDENKNFTDQNSTVNLEDSNGRMIWALGYFISLSAIMPDNLIEKASLMMQRTILLIENMESPRAIAFAIKGLYYYDIEIKSTANALLIENLGERLIGWYNGVSDENWQWFESYLTYANSILPEALLYVYLYSKNPIHRNIATDTFQFLLKHTFSTDTIKTISNKSWMHKGMPVNSFGEQPIDVAYTIMTLGVFYKVLKDDEFLLKMETAFNWFLGNNHLHQIIYNPCTGGCYDGLEEDHINLNQGAESTVCYLMARMTIERYARYL